MTTRVETFTDENGITFTRFNPEFVSQSMIKQFRACPRQTLYNQVQGLVPKVASRPLTRGTWFHELLEARYKGEDWRLVHKRWCKEYALLMDEEKEKLGDLPKEVGDLMLSYEWHYKNEFEHDEWEILETEKVLTATLPSGQKVKCKIDNLIKTRYGLYLKDHKTHKNIPRLMTRQMDVQSPMYVWIARENGYDVKGFIWNYIKTEGISYPKVLKDGKRFSKQLGATTYYVFARELKRSGLPVEDYRATLDLLKNDRYEWGKPNTSPFFIREVIEPKEESIQQTLREFMTGAERLTKYDFDPQWTERNTGDRCEWGCSYSALCAAELLGHNPEPARRMFKVESDSFHYYGENHE